METIRSQETIRQADSEKAFLVRKIMASAQGTEAYHRLSAAPLKCTDSIRAIAEAVGAFWLVDVIATNYLRPGVRPYRNGFIRVDVNVRDDRSAYVHLRPNDYSTGQTMQSVASQEIPATDFPQGLWVFWIEDGVLMCPGDH
jgi:hypothetical protein